LKPIAARETESGNNKVAEVLNEKIEDLNSNFFASLKRIILTRETKEQFSFIDRTLLHKTTSGTTYTWR